ncbi:MAG: tryptophan 2,3-dioxygenase family protein, partial [Planctomycetota bacterium]
PQQFLAFRDKLVPASGFQSFQVRELEILLGLPDSERLSYNDTDPLEHLRESAAASPGGRLARERIEAVRTETNLLDALRGWLHRTPVRGSSPGAPGDAEAIEGFLTDYLEALANHHERLASRMAESHGKDPVEMRARFDESTESARRFLQAEDAPEGERVRTRRVRAGILFIESYRDLPLLAWPRTLLDRFVEMEQELVLWRARHARMVERIIGRRVGTGGSAGVDYLDRTSGYRIFRELWAVRALLLPREALPPLSGAKDYGFNRGRGET